MMPGYIYILINAGMPGMVKIGHSTRLPEDRAKELSQPAGVPTPFIVAFHEEVSDCEEAENIVHSRLKQYRVNRSREFFSVPLKEAIRVVTEVARELREREEEAKRRTAEAERRLREQKR